MRKSCYQESGGGGGRQWGVLLLLQKQKWEHSIEAEHWKWADDKAGKACESSPPRNSHATHKIWRFDQKFDQHEQVILTAFLVSISRFHGPSPSSGSWCSAASSEQENRRPLLPRIQQCQIGRGARPICGVSCVQRQNSVKIVRKNRRRTKYSETGSIFASNLSWLHSLHRMWHNKKRWPLAEIQSALARALFLSARSSRLFCTPAFAWGEFMTFTTLQRQLCFKGCHYSLLLRFGLKAAVLRYGTNHTFSFLIKLVLLEAQVLVPFKTWHHIDVVMKQ